MKHYWNHKLDPLSMDHEYFGFNWEENTGFHLETQDLFYFFPEEGSFSRKGCLICNILSLRLWIDALKNGRIK